MDAESKTQGIKFLSPFLQSSSRERHRKGRTCSHHYNPLSPAPITGRNNPPLLLLNSLNPFGIGCPKALSCPHQASLSQDAHSSSHSSQEGIFPFFPFCFPEPSARAVLPYSIGFYTQECLDPALTFRPTSFLLSSLETVNTSPPESWLFSCRYL